MGTRGAYGFRKNFKDKITYNHFDSYPSWLGRNVLEFIAKNPLDKLEQIYDGIILVNDSINVSKEESNICEKYKKLLQFDDGLPKDWYSMLRNTQGNLDVYGEGLPYMIDNHDFIYDSLWCEYAYIINLDTQALEFYIGFQNTPTLNSPYGCIASATSDYFPCKCVLEIPLKNICAENIEGYIKEMEKISQRD